MSREIITTEIQFLLPQYSKAVAVIVVIIITIIIILNILNNNNNIEKIKTTASYHSILALQ